MLETGGPKKNKKKKTNGKAAKDNKNALTDTGFEETTKQKHVETLTFKVQKCVWTFEGRFGAYLEVYSTIIRRTVL